jgi:hypothetical protein
MRKTAVVIAPEWTKRDAKKHFLLTEMPAVQSEKWAMRFFIALKGTSAYIPEELGSLGMNAIAIRGLNSFLGADVDFAKLEPLLDEMMSCVKLVRDPAARDALGQPIGTPIVSDDDVEEPQTIMWLRSEVLRLHTNFSFLDALLGWVSQMNSRQDSGIT